MLAWTLLALSAVPEITEIIPVLKEQDMEEAVSLVEQYDIQKVRRIAPGGKERQDSIHHALKLISGHEGAVVIHDGVRPLIDPHTVRAALLRLPGCDGVVVGVPVKDTIKETEGETVKKTLRRETLWQAQTPQIFPGPTIASAYARASEEGFYATDDAALVERYGGKVIMVTGSYSNIKVTTPEDIPLAEAFLSLREAAG